MKGLGESRPSCSKALMELGYCCRLRARAFVHHIKSCPWSVGAERAGRKVWGATDLRFGPGSENHCLWRSYSRLPGTQAR
jgi:hypothetical protein